MPETSTAQAIPEPEAQPVVEPVASSFDPVDPFAEAPREAPAGEAPEASGPAASRLGEDAARAYLPLLFGVTDAIAGTGAIWLVRRKLGDRATAELLEQARTIAALSPTEKQALEAALVNRLAAIELTPDEALLYTVLGIYAAKTIAIYSLEAPDQLTVGVRAA